MLLLKLDSRRKDSVQDLTFSVQTLQRFLKEYLELSNRIFNFLKIPHLPFNGITQFNNDSDIYLKMLDDFSMII